MQIDKKTIIEAANNEAALANLLESADSYKRQRNEEITQLTQERNDLQAKRDALVTELNELKAKRHECNRRKAKRLAREMSGIRFQ